VVRVGDDTDPTAPTAPESPGAAQRAERSAAPGALTRAPSDSHVTRIESGAWGARALCACGGWGREFRVGKQGIYSQTKAEQMAENAAFFHREAMR